MKKTIVLLSILLATSFGYSQTNFSFIDDDMQWSYITFRSSEFQGPSYRETTLKKYIGDTTIHELHYKKMYESKDNGETWSELGYYREEGKIVYRIEKAETTESAYYNFNIQPESDEQTLIVVDSLTILGQQVPKYTCYYSFDGNVSIENANVINTIIDEIGNVSYWSNASGAPSEPTLLCVHKGNELLWKNPEFENCYYAPYEVLDLYAENATLLQESEAIKYSGDTFDDDLQFQLKGNVLYIFGTLELSCFSRGNWLLYTIDENTITLEDDTEEESGWIISKDRIFSLNSLQINNCSAELYNISFRGKMYSVQRSTSISTVNHQFTLSPNPVRDILKLSLQESQSIIQIYNMQGKMVLQTECGETANINVSMLSKGVYTLVVNNSVTQTFIKQ